MDSYSAIASLKDFGGAMAAIQQLEHYQLLGYVPVKYKDEKFLTSEEKTYKKIVVGKQKYFLQPPK